MALNLSMDRQIAQIEAVCDYVQGRVRSPKKLWLSFDEWNVWYRQRGGDGGKKASPHLLEELDRTEGDIDTLMARIAPVWPGSP